MEESNNVEEKKCKKLIWLIIILTGLVLGLSGYIIYNKIINSDNNCKKTTGNVDDSIISYELSLKEKSYINLNKYINFDIDEEKIVNITISNVMLNKKDHTIYFKNFTSNLLLCMEDDNLYDNLILDDKVLFNQIDEGCYLSLLEFIAILDNKYIAAKYSSEGEEFLIVFDENGEQVDILYAISIDYKADKIVYEHYEENDPKFILNEYSYNYENGKRITNLTKEGTESYCNYMTDTGYCDYNFED